MGRNQQARRAKPALHRAVVGERRLQSGQGRVATQALKRHDLATLAVHSQRKAGPLRTPVDHHGARAADTLIAPSLCGGKLALIAQHGKEVIREKHLEPADTTVDLEGCCHPRASSWRASPTAAPTM